MIIRYTWSYFFGFFPLFFMIVPPGLLLNLAFPTLIGAAENWFILTPDSPFKSISVYMMILHNVQAWVLWVRVCTLWWMRLAGRPRMHILQKPTESCA